jgi:hypothetical protein
MTELNETPTPFPVQVAAFLVWMYGIAVVMNAMAWAVGYDNKTGIVMACGRLLLAGIVGFGLLNLKRWAWWTTIICAPFIVLGSLLGFVAMKFLIGRGIIQSHGLGELTLLLSALFCTVAWIYLMSSRSRQAFFTAQPLPAAKPANAPPIPSPWGDMDK